MEYLGVVKWFDNSKGYGFIVSERVEEDIMLHYSELKMEGFKTAKTGDKVRFQLASTRDQGFSATDVVLV